MSRLMHDGYQDGLIPTRQLDLSKAAGTSGLLEQMSATAFGGRSLGNAYEVLCHMIDDQSCTKILTISGAMTIAKMGLILCDMIARGMVDIIISTGAIITHDLAECLGGKHFKHDPRISDYELFNKGYFRVYDTIELEANLCEVEDFLEVVFDGLNWSKPYGSVNLNEAIGKKLVEQEREPSVLAWAYKRGVPVYVPAFTDSGLGLSLSTYFISSQRKRGLRADASSLFSFLPPFNPYVDLHDYANRLLSAERLGIFTIGGGVPRNWAQQIAPFTDMVNYFGQLELRVPRFQYGLRICPEPEHWGGLSGCSYSEGASWGKFVGGEDGGEFAEVRCDATIAWPVLIKAILERAEKA